MLTGRFASCKLAAPSRAAAEYANEARDQARQTNQNHRQAELNQLPSVLLSQVQVVGRFDGLPAANKRDYCYYYILLVTYQIKK